MANRRRRGFTIIDGLVGAIVMGLTVGALFQGWSVMFRRDSQSRLISQAGQQARAEMERLKVLGADNLPLGTYSGTTQTAVWSGAYSPSATGFVAGGIVYYDAFGNQVASATATGAALALQDTITSSSVLAGSSGYILQPNSKCSIVVKVTQISDGTVLFSVASNLVEGGL